MGRNGMVFNRSRQHSPVVFVWQASGCGKTMRSRVRSVICRQFRSKVKNVIIHTDGGCEGNPGPGGWAATLAWNGRTKHLSGGEPATTNNRMELTAAIQGLRILKEPCVIEFFTDSEYLRKGITEWIKGWKARGWQTRQKTPVKNGDLWRELDDVSARHQITWRWVKGHAGHDGNEQCDQMARDAIIKVRQQYRPDQLSELLKAFRRTTEEVSSDPQHETSANLF